MRRTASCICLIILAMAVPSYAMGEEKFFPPVNYAYIQNDQEATHLSSGTGGTQPLLGNSLVPGSGQTYEQWWEQGDPNDPGRRHMQEIVDRWKQEAIDVWQLRQDADPLAEVEFDENVVGRLLSVRSERGFENGNAPCAVFDLTDGRQLQLSDIFYDGFNYIDYINTFLAQKPDQCYHTYWSDNGPIEEMFKRPFAGLARDYPYFNVVYPSDVYEVDDPLPVMLQLMWTDTNPYWQTPMTDTGAGPEEDYCFVGVPLTHWASPYGECLIDVKLTPERWQDFTFFAPQITIDEGRCPEAESKINQVLDQMAASFREMRIPDAIDEDGFGYYQIAPSIVSRGQTLHVWLDVPTPNYTVTVFDGIFDLHTGRRLMDIGNRIDGNAELIELTIPFQARQMGISQEEAACRVSHGWEGNALERLLKGEIDLALVTTGKYGIMEQWTGTGTVPPSGEETDEAFYEADAIWEDFEFIPIARDALVFADRIENPVRTLTLDQLRWIYKGNVDSWEEVGGSAQPIDALAPHMGTTAWSMFNGFFLREIDEGRRLSYGDWEQLSRLGYKGKEGLATIQWAERWEEGKKPGLRMLAVEGIAPTYQTVFDGSYPLSVTYYAVLKKGLPLDHPATQLTNWLLSDEGQQVLRTAGYAAVR